MISRPRGVQFFTARRRPPPISWIGAALVLLLANCGVVLNQGSVREAPEEVGRGEVAMEVFSGPGVGTLLLVPVSFEGQGPFKFVLDTGASRTVLDPALVKELGLAEGRPAQGKGIGSEINAVTVKVDAWKVGAIDLQPRTIVAAGLPETPEQGPQFRGLLGSDVLAGFGVVEIDYDNRVLRLRSGNAP